MPAARRLAAVMFTDMAGFTATAQSDESAALRLVQEQESIVRPLSQAYQGRTVKSTGDGFLLEFDSALNAVRCGIEILERVHERNSRTGTLPIRLRIGIHLGDVEEREGDVFGDAVNIASRVEHAATPGGVLLSAEVFSQVHNKLPNTFERLGPRVLRDVRTPIDLYRVVLPWEPPPGTSDRVAPGTRLAVLPLANISPDPKDEYIADGLTEELITTISKLRPLTVIARTSVVQYKATTKPVAQIASELGVGSILEGSVRRAGTRLRVTAQLIDVGTQGHLWAESYDRDLDDLLAIQVDIAQQVAKALQVELVEPPLATRGRQSTVRPDSYLAYLRGRALLHDTSRTAREAAQAEFERAVALDPTNAAAYSGLADIIRISGWRSNETPRAVWHEKGRGLATRAIELDPEVAEAHASLALVLWDDLNYSGAEAEFRRSVSLNPSYALAHFWYGGFLEEEARAEEALREFRLAEAADPYGPETLYQLARLLTYLGRHDEASSAIHRLGQLEPEGLSVHLALAAHHQALGDVSRAVEELHRSERSASNPNVRPILRALVAVLGGERDAATELLRQVETAPGYPQVAYYAALAYAQLGDLDRCFRALDVAFEGGMIPMQQWRLDPDLAPVRRDPRFAELLKKLRISPSRASSDDPLRRKHSPGQPSENGGIDPRL